MRSPALLTALVSLAALTGARALAQEPAAPPAQAPDAPPAAPASPAAPEPGAAPVMPRPPEPPSPPRGPVAFGANLGMFTGTGVGVQAGAGAAGVRVAAGWAPLLIVATERGATVDDTAKLKFYSGLIVAPDLYLRVAKIRGRSSFGLEGGYRYSSQLGSGGAAGLYFQIPMGSSVDVLVCGGLLFFPDGEDRLKDKHADLRNADFSFPGPNVNVAVSIGLLMFP